METQFWIKLRFSECGLVEALVDVVPERTAVRRGKDVAVAADVAGDVIV
jgi:hypothetical protein